MTPDPLKEKELVTFDKAKLRKFILNELEGADIKAGASRVYVWIEDNREK